MATIKQVITLEGAERIQQQLKDLGLAGSATVKQLQNAINGAKLQSLAQAFDQIKRAGSELLTGIKNVRNDLAPLGDGLQQLGKIAGITLGGGLAGVVTGLVLMSKSAVDAAARNDQLAKGLGLTVDQLGALKRGAQEAGIAEDQLVTALSRFARAAQAAGTTQQTGLVGIGKLIAASFSDAGFTTLAATDTVAQVLAKLRPIAQELQGLFQNTGNELLKGLSTDQLVFELQRLLSQGKITIQQLNELGAQLKISDPLAQLDEILKANSTDLAKLGVNFLDANGKFVGTREALARVADLFASMPDGIQKTALASSVFTRQIGPELIPFLDKGRAGIDALETEYKKLGLALSDADKKTAQLARGSFLQLDSQATRLKNSLGLAFAPGLAAAAQGFADAIQDNISTITAFAKQIADSVFPVVLDLVRLLSGRSDLVQNKWILDWADAAKQFGSTIKDTIANVVTPAFSALRGLLDDVAQAINSTFGTKLTGDQLGIGLLIGQITGVNSAILDIVKSVGLIGVGFIGLLGPIGEVAAAIAVVTAALALWPRTIEDAQQQERLFRDYLATLGIGNGGPPLLGAGGGGFAEGGLFRGRPGKDTNLAWLTDFEFVMNPAAVRKYGVGFMHMINSLRLPIDQLRGFSLGGLVDGLRSSMSVPAFATGGLNLAPIGGSRGRPITLVLDGRAFGGLSAPDDVASQLLRFARTRARASAGRAPSRVR